MLEWTGERFLPWIRESTIAYEHLHRYAYAASFVRNKRVLDLASGEGYGSKILSEAASSVVGVDIDDTAVRHATAKYGGNTLQFLAGSITAVPIKEDQSFDVIVCFEAIEHIKDHEELFSEVKRLLTPNGIFIVSTPNKAIYHDEAKEENSFHVKELYFEEFQQLLTRHFKNIRFFGQRVHPGSSIWSIGAESTTFQELALNSGLSSDFEFIPLDKRLPLYFIALASDSSAPLPLSCSSLMDESDSLIEEKNDELRKTKASAVEAIRWNEQRIKDREDTMASLEEAMAWRVKQIEDLNKQVEGQSKQTEGLYKELCELKKSLEWSEGRAADLSQTIASHEEALAWRARQVSELEKDRAKLHITEADLRDAQSILQDTQSILRDRQSQLNRACEQLELIHASSGWKLILRGRHLRESLLPADSSRRRFFEKIMRRLRSRI